MLHVAFPDPYAVVHLDGVEVGSTAVYKKSLNPNWDEVFKLWVHSLTMEAKTFTYTFCSSVTKQSRIEVDIIDEKKLKKGSDHNYLGSIRFRLTIDEEKPKKGSDHSYLGSIRFQVGEAIDLNVESSL